MLAGKTVLVVGAGASAEYQMPTGAQLAAALCRDLNFYIEGHKLTQGDPDLFTWLDRAHPKRIGQIFEAGRLIANGLPFSRSIDDFLFNHGHDPLVVTAGKFAIVNAILRAESKSTVGKLRNDQGGGWATSVLKSLDKTWLVRLFTILQTGITAHEIGRIFENITIINFNYDRVIEVVLHRLLQQAYSISQADAAAVMNSLDIIHPYGAVAPLPWQLTSKKQPVRFGQDPSEIDGAAFAQNIRTYTERSHEDAELDKLGTIVHTADHLVFLGFGFHGQNLELLSRNNREEYPVLYATTYDEPSANAELFMRRMGEVIFGRHAPVLHVGQTCGDFFHHYGLTIAG